MSALEVVWAVLCLTPLTVDLVLELTGWVLDRCEGKP